jgi:hypothetical protein
MLKLYQTFKEELKTILFKVFLKIEKERTLPKLVRMALI